MAKKEDKPTYTPMMEQYLSIKQKHQDVLILFRLGDFYELFFDDAKIASKELQLYLTGKSAGQKEKVPMCGIPHHAYLTYVKKLLDKGYKVGIVEQLEDPKLAKKLVERDVVQIITPGTTIEVQEANNNYIASLVDTKYLYSLALADISTGETLVMNIDHVYEEVLAQLVNYEVKELVVSTSLDASLITLIKENTKICITYYNNDEISLDYEAIFTYVKDERQMVALSKLLNYFNDTQKRSLDYFKPAKNKVLNKVLKIDHSSRVNLELTKSLNNEGTYGSLYWLLNKCKTNMGSRLLKASIDEPLSSITDIEKRLDIVELFVDNYIVRKDLMEELDSIYDLERLIARVGFDSCSGREMLQLKKSLKQVPLIKETLNKIDSSLTRELAEELGDFSSLVDVLERAVSEECPLSIKEGGIFKKGFNKELDEIIDISTSSRKWLLDLEAREKERTGIHNLKVGYSKIFGYYIEVSVGSLSLVKDEFNYIRKQTLTTGERFITQELKEAEDKILHAEETRIDMEYKLFQKLREYVKGFTLAIQNLSLAISRIDMYVSLGEVSSKANYVRPIFNEERKVEILDARHPVIEVVMPEKEFVSNDYKMDKDMEVMIITGPNMGGKSTYMREFALLVVMAQLGCFVPARYCNLCIFDSIFTRIGASDDLLKGQSTFMVEMSETNRALRNATSSSLLIFDEIGRGTATYDGMALAQAIIEFIVSKIHAKTMFSTHYHEITSLVSHIESVKNVHVSVKEKDGLITFLYKVQEGEMDKSYGINVARLAGLPEDLLERANEILNHFEERKVDVAPVFTPIKKEEKSDKSEVEEMIRKIDPLTLSPLEALNMLFEMKKKVK
ncbi:MAG: DNA mismatch repair protein MutS [Bacilli bacterium]|nr:DNA mismatch repair protein MutS [Bacilli bacterium]